MYAAQNLKKIKKNTLSVFGDYKKTYQGYIQIQDSSLGLLHTKPKNRGQ